MEDQRVDPTPRVKEKLPLDNSFRVVQLAIDFSKSGKDIIRLAEEDKKTNFSKITKLAKKMVSAQSMTKLMKSNNTLDRKRQESLQEFIYITDKLKQRVSAIKEQDSRMTEDIKQCVQEGHMILAAVILHEAHTIISLYSSSISKSNLVRLLLDVKSYCESVNTMKFPVEWENLITEDKKKTVTLPSNNNNNTSNSEQSKRDQSINRKQPKEHTKANEGHEEDLDPTKKIKSPESESDKEDTEKESEGEETHTVQIEIRGNTGGFVGSTIEFDLVVTYEDGSPVKVQSSDFAVEINGPASTSRVTISTKNDSSFRIEFIPLEPGANTLSIYMHNTLLTSGIKSIISKAGETAFLVHSKDFSRGQLQGISVVPLSNHETKSLSKSDLLKLKLVDIATALQILENIRQKTIAELEKLSADTLT